MERVGKMKFFATAVLLVSMWCLCKSAEAGSWSAWSEVTIVANGSHTVYFIPGVEGTHKIQFLNDQPTYQGGEMESYWGSSDNVGTWYWWATSDVFYYTRTQTLESGSDDIIYKFVFYNINNFSVVFNYRFYTDD
ncbi:MAG: hypothetical protein WC457_01830 [Patescibacteria group bacterium]